MRVTLSPRKSTPSISHCPAGLRATVNRPLRVEMSSLSLIELASGQRLEYVDAARLVHGVAEMGAVADHSPVHEDRHVPAQRRLVVEDVSAGLRVGGEEVVQHCANRATASLGCGAGNVELDVGREHDLGHCWYSFRPGRCVRSTDPATGRPQDERTRRSPTSWEKKRQRCAKGHGVSRVRPRPLFVEISEEGDAMSDWELPREGAWPSATQRAQGDRV